MNDLIFENHGTIWLMTPNTDAGKDWVNEHIPEDAMKHGNAIVIEHRYVWDIINGALADGLIVEEN